VGFSLIGTARQGLKGNLNRLGIGRGLESRNANSTGRNTEARRSSGAESGETAPHARQGTGETSRSLFQMLGIVPELPKSILSLGSISDDDDAKRPLIRH
jgi:hypothetical protein